MSELVIKGFQETSFLDWDGKIVSTIFVPRCNFRCPFCHNFGLVENSHDYETIAWPKIEQFLLERKDFIDGICLTGGEPCLHKDQGLVDFLQKIKKLGLAVKLDTNGAEPEVLQDLINQKLVDFVAMDIKGPLDKRYDQLSGVKTNLEKIKQSLKILMTSGIEYELRVTVVPTLLRSKDLEAMAKEVKGAQKFVLQQFVPDNCWAESLRTVKPYPKEELDKMLEVVKPHVKAAIVRGV